MGNWADCDEDPLERWDRPYALDSIAPPSRPRSDRLTSTPDAASTPDGRRRASSDNDKAVCASSQERAARLMQKL
jgi:hypothetical protein